MSHLRISELTKKFGSTTAVNNFSIDIKKGESVVLLGPSGCGKTTLLKLIAGFTKPDEGKISVENKDISTPYEVLPPDKRQMSMVFQSYAIWPHKTVFENVAYGLTMRNMSKTVIQTKVRDVLDLVQLTGFEERYSTQLSGGQQQRVALARAMVVEPSILLLDEPLSNLDANLRVEMREELSALHKRVGITFVYVTHDQAEAMVLAQRIILMRNGLLVQEGTPKELYEKPKNSFVASFIGVANIFSGHPESSSLDEKNRIRVKTSCGSIQVGQQTQQADLSKDKIFFCVRPEWVEFPSGPFDPDANQFKTKILKRQYYGKTINYTAAIGEQEISIEAKFKHDFQVGAEVTVELPPDRCVCLLEN